MGYEAGGVLDDGEDEDDDGREVALRCSLSGLSLCVLRGGVGRSGGRWTHGELGLLRFSWLFSALSFLFRFALPLHHPAPLVYLSVSLWFADSLRFRFVHTYSLLPLTLRGPFLLYIFLLLWRRRGAPVTGVSWSGLVVGGVEKGSKTGAYFAKKGQKKGCGGVDVGC